MPEVTVYSTRQCPYCRMVKAFLEKHGVEYRDIDAGAEENAAADLYRISGQLGVPVTVVGEEVIVGFDAPRLTEVFGAEPGGDTFDVVILGAGPAGLTAAVYTARKSLSTLVISENIGGQAMESWAVENYMGYRMVTGEDLMTRFEEQARGANVRLELDRVTGVSRAPDGLFAVTTYAGQTFQARSVIVATGRRSRRLGVEGEEKFWGRGVSVCSTCDGPLFKGRDVAVVGGGNSAVTAALEMARIAHHVHLIVRSQLRADPVYADRLAEHENITMHMPYTVTGLLGGEVLTGVRIREAKSGRERRLTVDGVFAEIGHEPNTAAVKDLVRLNDQAEIQVDENCQTSQPGIFAAGDVTSVRGKQIIIAAGEGAKAALEVHAYLMAGEVQAAAKVAVTPPLIPPHP
ncbi:glutaredoxin [Methanofollis aquaemaris]|uniref:Glutaredoxin n=1 Tax=Methanofollis aquaemaris TaxID=126734 RepID=A0A8A3S7D9_9EURY|nr:FAD-dependent oxidoreductase [Methanofollis aquaemaris]QSZ67594.1 glutaredoxin [Methanofollis aquaemaris]